MGDQAASLRKLIEDKGSGQLQAQPQQMLTKYKLSRTARVIAITSGKGGVGKTNLVVNLALALAQEGKRSVIIDADLGMANVDILFGSSSKYSLMDLLRDGVRLEDVMQTIPAGISYVPGGSGIEKAAELQPQEQAKLLSKLAGCSEGADFIFVDTGAGLGKNVMDFVLVADEVILVTTPEPTSITDAYAMMKAYSVYAEERNMNLVVNRVYDESEGQEVIAKLQGTADRFLRLRVGSLGYIYEDRDLMRAVRSQRPLLDAYPQSLAAHCMKAIARNLLYGEQNSVPRGWKFFLRRFFDFSR